MPNILYQHPLNGENRDSLSAHPVDVLAFHPEREPGLGREVDRLPDVEPRREAAMVRAGKGEHELPWSLQRLVDLDSLRLQIGGAYHCYNIKQNVRILLEKEGALVLDGPLEVFPVALGHTVPELGLAPVAVIDRRQHQVLVVPAEG